MREWIVTPKGDVGPFVDRYKLHPAVAQCLINRGIALDRATDFIQVPAIYHDPKLLPDIDKAVERLKAARQTNEKVMIYRDYDVDGTMGGVILVKALRKAGMDPLHFAPNRFRDGYGLHKQTIDHVASLGCTLIVTVDCGISSVDEVEYAKSLGIDVIVTDHHEPGPELPNAVAVVNPKVEGHNYPFRELCGAAIAWKLAQAFLDEPLHDLLDLVAVATVADIVPLQDENRVIVRHGLKRLNSSDVNLGLANLIHVSGFQEVDTSVIGFGIGPRINAIGRLGDPNVITELFLSDSVVKTEKMASIANEINTRRQKLVDQLTLLADDLIKTQWDESQHVVVLSSPHFHEGVIGIVASRVLEKLQRPTIIIAEKEDGVGKASCRSVGSFHLHRSLSEVQHLLKGFGGHAMAAGFSIEVSQIDAFRKAINEIGSRLTLDSFRLPVLIDGVLDLEEVGDYLIEQLKALAPFGAENPEPCFMVKGVSVNHIDYLTEGKHLKLIVKDVVERKVIGFGFGQWGREAGLREGMKLDIAFRPTVNLFAGQSEIQLEIIDVRISDETTGRSSDTNQETTIIDIQTIADRLFGRERERELHLRGRYDDIASAPFFRTKLAGVSHEGRQDVVRSLATGDPLYLRREPHNPWDEHAIAVFTENNLQVGYINRRLAEKLAPFIDDGTNYSVTVLEVTGGEGKDHFGVNVLLQQDEDDEPIKVEIDSLAEKPKLEKENDILNSSALDVIRKTLIGEHEYHEKQLEALSSIFARENSLVVMGTGRGKSAIFQTGASYKAILESKKTVIFYPLKALLNDQYYSMQRLSSLGIRVAIASGVLNKKERQELFRNLQEIDVLLATPEFVLHHKARFHPFFNDVGFVVFDECHHLADDRAGYQQVSHLLSSMPEAHVMLASATVNEQTLRKIEKEIRLDRVIFDDTVRECLHLVDNRNCKDKERVLFNVLAQGEKTVIFCNSKRQTVSLAETIREYLMQTGKQKEVAYYNADLNTELRAAIEREFRDGNLNYVVATSAFGEGVNIPDIRHVVHYHLPLSLSAFLQASGRGGRDGRDAFIHLLYNDRDAKINEFLIEEMSPSKEILMAISQTLRELADDNGTLKANNNVISERVVQKLGRNISSSVIDTALRIFSDLDVIEIDWEKGRRIRVRGEKEVVLHESVVYSESIRDRRACLDYMDWAKTASDEEMEMLIRKPLLPVHSWAEATV